MSEDHDESELHMFEEPEGYFQPDKLHSYQNFTLETGETLNLRLVGHNPLWGHHLWQASTTIARFLEQHLDDLVRSKKVLELGAGAGLPSLLASLHGAEKVVVTDYPDSDLVENLEYNVSTICKGRGNIEISGYRWGQDTVPLLSFLPIDETRTSGFDTIILADLLFNHSCHSALLKTLHQTLARTVTARALVFFTPYRPWLLKEDLAFFDLVRDTQRFEIRKLGEWIMDKVMFEEDPGDERLRRTVFGWEVSWRYQECHELER